MSSNTTPRIKYVEEKGQLVIRINLHQKGRKAASGKSYILAETEGQFQKLDTINEALEGHAIVLRVIRQATTKALR